MSEVEEVPIEVVAKNMDIDGSEQKMTFGEVREQAWQKSQETLTQWQSRIKEKVVEQSAGINQYLKDLSTLYGEPAPENISVSLQYYPNEGSQKGEPINNFVESGRLDEDTADVLLWVSDPSILPTDTSKDIEKIYKDTTDLAVATIMHESQHRSFQREGFQELIRTSEQHPDVDKVLSKLEDVRGDYIEVTNELITTYLENFGRKRVEQTRTSTGEVGTPITIEVNKEKSGDVLEAVIREDIEEWRDKGKGHGPYTDLRQRWEKVLGGLPEGYQTKEEDGDVTQKDSDRTYMGTNVYEIAREMGTSLAERYVEQGMEMDTEFVVELYKMVDQKLKSSEADGAVERSVESEIDKSVDAIKESISEALTIEGLIPEIGERGEDEGFNSEMLGYALRIAVETGDEDLFRRLKKGADFMKMDNGLYRARLDKDKNPDTSQGSTWADANQDIALALIEAGEAWSDDRLTQEGVGVAKSFLDAQVAESGDFLVPLQNTVDEEEAKVGDRLRRINPSMYNFKLYERMVEVDIENRERWTTLNASGIRLVDACLDTYRLPPNTLNLIDGRVVTNEEFVRGVKGGTNTEVVPVELLEKVKSLPEDSEAARSIWGFDSMRIPFRLNDSELAEAKRLASIIGEKLDDMGGVRTKYYAIDGTEHSDGMSAAVVEAPLSVSTANKLRSKKAAVKKIKYSVTETDRQVLYWQLWRGMGLVQLKESKNIR